MLVLAVIVTSVPDARHSVDAGEVASSTVHGMKLAVSVDASEPMVNVVEAALVFATEAPEPDTVHPLNM